MVLVVLGLAGCAAPARRGAGGAAVADPATRTESAVAAPSRARWGVPQWEAWQKRQAEVLVRVAAETPRSGPGPAGPPPAPPRVDPGPRPVPLRRARRRAAGDSAAGPPSLRCRRVCRHVRAICYAATRICRIAEHLAEPAAQRACRRGRERCADARALARRTCSSCGS